MTILDKIYKNEHTKQTNKSSRIFIGLIERNVLLLRFYILFESHYIMGIMWCSFFLCNFNTAKALIFEFVCGVSHLFPLYIFSSCSRYCVRECRQGVQCPFANCNTCARKDDGGYGGRPSSPTHSPPYIVFSYHSKHSIYQADCRSSSRTRLHFLFFAP